MPRAIRRIRGNFRLVVLTVALVALLAAAVGHFRRDPAPATVASRPPERPEPSGSPSPSRVTPASYPASGPGTWQYADAEGPVFGDAGPVRRYRVAVESGVPYPVADFAAKVDTVLGDPRSWTAGGEFRLQRVPGNAHAEFTVFLATRDTSTQMCLAGGVRTDGYTSCRTTGRVIINLDRWVTAIPDYGAPLDTYRTYVLNHETGHELGHGHELCPGAGRPAPVMEQQTLGLHGCTANPWPYLGGERYAGPPGQY
jgi:hypothetical protein